MSTTPRQIRDLSVGLALSALSTAAAVHAQPRVIYADASAPAGGNGTTWNAAYRDLQDALAAANADPIRYYDGVQIRIARGIYSPDRGTGNRDASFALNSGVILMGGFAGLLGGANPDQRDLGQFVSVLSGDLARNDGPDFANYSENSRTVVNASNSALAVLNGLEISSGNADAASGAPGPKGVLTSYALNPTGTARHGGLSIINCRVMRNRATTGSILHISYGGAFDSHISGNWTQDQPVITARPTTFFRSVIRGNRCTSVNPTGAAGAILLQSSGASGGTRFQQCLIVDNVSDGRGAIYSPESDLTLQLLNCTVAGNSSTRSEAIRHTMGTLKLRNCVIGNNPYITTPSSAAQIAVLNPLVLDIDISVLIENGAQGVRFTQSSAIPGPYLSGDPKFVSPAGSDGNPLTWQDNDYRLRSGSPAVDRANATDPIFAPGFTDLDGMPLFDDPGTVNFGFGAVTYGDLGCFEYQRIITGDFDNSGTITVSDIFAFLTAWFAGNPLADLDGNGIGTSDVFTFLTAWFASV